MTIMPYTNKADLYAAQKRYRERESEKDKALLALLEQFPRLLRRHWEEGQIARLQGFMQDKAYGDALAFANEVLARGPDAGKTEAEVKRQIEIENYEDKHGRGKFKGRNRSLNLPSVPGTPSALAQNIRQFELKVIPRKGEKTE